MQQYKSTKQIGVIKEVASNNETLTDSLAEVCDRFKLKNSFATMDALKARGFTISSLLAICTILPFEGVASVYALLKHGITRMNVGAKKDAFYTAKNNENIDWRCLLTMIAKRFIYLVKSDINTCNQRITAIIFDDTLLEKTGKCIEKVSVTFDHVSKRYILGYKLLVCGFWDGESFIPLDFSLHREKGTKQDELSHLYLKTTKVLRATKTLVKKQVKTLAQKQSRLMSAEQTYANTPNKTNQNKLAQAQLIFQKAEGSLQANKQQLIIDDKAQRDAKRDLKKLYTHGRLFGLTAKERKQQYKKLLSAQSCGFKRRKEADRSKGESLIAMLRRAVKNNFIPRYVLTDSWFFSESLIANVKAIKNGCIDLVSMVKINNQVFHVGKDNKEIGVKILLKNNESKAVRCKKFKASYMKINCKYKGMPLNLFFVKMGRSSNWHLIATTDLTLNFIALLEVYQIRWGIEVFFKECKQYLNLGQCKSSNFDAQIADTTITMIQYTMLCYCKRISYQTSFADLFKGLNDERVQHNLLTQLMQLFWKLIKLFCFSSGFDFITIQKDMMQNPEIINQFAQLIPQGIFNKAA